MSNPSKRSFPAPRTTGAIEMHRLVDVATPERLADDISAAAP